MPHSEILFDERVGKNGQIGLITLNRPNALNALNMSMCIAMNAKLHSFENDNNIKAVVIRGTGERAFCAGGDIRHLYEMRKRPLSELRLFFWHEYRLNHRIHHFKKPYISFLNGITMGGGVGISVHGSHRIATEHLKFAMPETGIGFFPDVGGSYFLPRIPGKTGYYLALTGASIQAADAKYITAANHFVPAAALDELLSALLATTFSNDAHATVTDLISQFETDPGQPVLAEHQAAIERCFSSHCIGTIIDALHAENDPWCQQTAALLSTKSPTSLKVVLQQLNYGGHLTFDDCMRMEYCMVQRFLQEHDFYEGVRAALVDKDRTPHWQPDCLEGVTANAVAGYFKTAENMELSFQDDLKDMVAMGGLEPPTSAL